MADEQTEPKTRETALRPMPAQVDLPALEHEVLARWRESNVFERSMEQTKDGPRWVVYEGPPTANGMPGVHHVEARVFKDVFPRFKTMKGFHVPRKAGWDCHGLPVEVAVEKELGLSGKRDIEAYGVAEFNARCRESVLRHVDAFETMTERMGYWVDMSQAYRTMDADYIEAVWWSLKTIFEKGLLVRDHRISPYCPRCGTPLSDHELGQPGAYETVIDPSVTVRLPITSGVLAGQADLLVWTTTPWTLVSNTAVAVHPDVTYVVARKIGNGEQVVVAEPLFAKVLGERWRIIERHLGADLEGVAYRRPFELVAFPAEPDGSKADAADAADAQGRGAHRVVLADFVSVEDGTGLVHLAPAFGADDFTICRANGMPVVNPIRPDGRFEDAVPLVGGQFFKDADKRLVENLDDRGVLFHAETYEHSYPHCWRCHTPLLYYALPSWYIRTTAIKDALLTENERTNWNPETIKWGRYGEWLRNNVDWALSRSRYWGTPLPIWVCPDDHITCVGSLAELDSLAGRDLSGLDPHRPYVDDVTFACPHGAGAAREGAPDAPFGSSGSSGPCGAEARRVPEVIDAWYDSGAMPFAQFGAPHRGEEEFGRSYPAHFICEAIDQTRGWFYSLMGVGTLVFGRSSYANVVCLGHILAEDGRKMSKHLGNVLEPIPLMERHGADALRWFMAAGGSPWTARRVGQNALEEVVRKVLLTYWNTASFFVLYVNAAASGSSDGQGSGDGRDRPWTLDRLSAAPPYPDRPLLDRWVLAELHRTVGVVDAALEGFDTAAAGRRLAEFIDDLSNWYVRRSRRRFWEGPDSPEGASAFATLYECLETLTRLLAPFMPFVTDYVWDVLRTADAPSSVHLASWPRVNQELLDERLTERMALVRRLVELGRAARASSGVRTRQPLGRALVGASGWDALPAELRAQIAEELNVVGLDGLASMGGELVEYAVKPNYRALGARFAKDTPKVARAIEQIDPSAVVTAVREAGSASVTVDGSEVRIGPEEVIVTERPRTGWAVAGDAGETVALDLTVTAELRRAGLVREVIRLVQEARKAIGLDITDRVELWWEAADRDLAEALREQGATVAGEVLAEAWHEARPKEELIEHRDEELRLSFWLRPTGGH